MYSWVTLRLHVVMSKTSFSQSHTFSTDSAWQASTFMLPHLLHHKGKSR